MVRHGAEGSWSTWSILSLLSKFAFEMTGNMVILCKPDRLESLKISRLCLKPAVFIPTLNFQPTNRQSLDWLMLPYVLGPSPFGMSAEHTQLCEIAALLSSYDPPLDFSLSFLFSTIVPCWDWRLALTFSLLSWAPDSLPGSWHPFPLNLVFSSVKQSYVK